VESSGRFKPFIELHFADRHALQATLELKHIAIVTGAAPQPTAAPASSDMEAEVLEVDPSTLPPMRELPLVPINGCLICLASSYHAPRSCPRIKERTQKKNQFQTSRLHPEAPAHQSDPGFLDIKNPEQY
jgi:hypothetical protein